MNKKVSMNSFLKKYVCHLSGQDSLKMSYLVEEANNNDRLKMPLFMYVNETEKDELFEKRASAKLKEEYKEFIEELHKHKSYDAMYESKGRDPEGVDEFSRVYKAYLRSFNDYDKTLDLRKDMFEYFHSVLDSGKTTKYQLCKVGNVKMQNFNKAYNDGDYSKVSLEKCQMMYKYAHSL